MESNVHSLAYPISLTWTLILVEERLAGLLRFIAALGGLGTKADQIDESYPAVMTASITLQS